MIASQTNDDSSSTYANQQLARRAIFNPPLSVQRYCWVENFIKQQGCSVTSVTDVGCGNGRMLNWLKCLPHVTRINCIDANHSLLEYEMDYHIRPNLCEMLFGRKVSTQSLNLRVFHGDIAVPDDRLEADCFTMVEMIEHISLEHVQRVNRTVFGYHQPMFVIVTTPNREFNHLLRGDDENHQKFRHADHKFEWNRLEFSSWAQSICTQYPYEVYLDGVGHLPGSEPYGPATQIALFKRTRARKSAAENDLECFDLLLNKLIVEEGESEFNGDVKLRKISLMTSFEIPGMSVLAEAANSATPHISWDDNYDSLDRGDSMDTECA